MYNKQEENKKLKRISDPTRLYKKEINIVCVTLNFVLGDIYICRHV